LKFAVEVVHDFGKVGKVFGAGFFCRSDLHGARKKEKGAEDFRAYWNEIEERATRFLFRRVL
jgi:hypothetical protein